MTPAEWVDAHATPGPAQLARLEARIDALDAPPLISVVTPVFDPPVEVLRATLASVRAQAYPHWEWVVADDRSTNPAIVDLLLAAEAEDPRIKVHLRGLNGHICAATNTAIDAATGDLLAFLDHDDRLPPQALAVLALEAAAWPKACLFYSDEAMIDAEGAVERLHFKPAPDRDLLQAQNYFNHLSAYPTDLVRALGGLREGYEGSQDHDLALRVLRRAEALDRPLHETVRRIPHVLYHWRAFDGAESFSQASRTRAVEAGRQAVRDDLAARSERAVVEAGPNDYHRVVRPLPDSAPRVGIVIPTRDAADHVRACLTGLGATDYPNFFQVLVDNGTVEADALALLDEAEAAGATVLRRPGPFDFSALVNAGAAAAEARGAAMICLLNNDVTAEDPGWLKAMAAQGARADVGAVGARLLYPDGRIQHAGVTLGLGGVAHHPFRGRKPEDGSYYERARLAHGVSAVTGACLLTPMAVFDAVGGLDPAFPIAFNDVDYCLKLRARGLKVIYEPAATLIHAESASRGEDGPDPHKAARLKADGERFVERWGARIEDDPAYSPNLSLEPPGFALASAPRIRAPWDEPAP